MSQLPKELAEARDKAAEQFTIDQNGQFSSKADWIVADTFKAGAKWLHAHLLSLDPGEFDELAALNYFKVSAIGKISLLDRHSVVSIARWQAEQSRAQIAALKREIERLKVGAR